MAYIFHHIPKCGGTSFRGFLQNVFDLIEDYPGGGAPSVENPNFAAYLEDVPKLSSLGSKACLAGHYNVAGIRLLERFPDLDFTKVKVFSIIRDPFETAVSGAYYNAKRGIPRPGMAIEDVEQQALNRFRFISNTLGIASREDIDTVLGRYWFVAPLDRIEDAKTLIEETTGMQGPDVGHENRTFRNKGNFSENFEERFRRKAALDMEVFLRSQEMFAKKMGI